LSTSTVVDKWEKEVIKSDVIKTLRVPLQLNQIQQKILDEWINTSNYVYNKTIEKIKAGMPANWMNMRDLLVTNRSKKKSNEYKQFDDKFNNLRKEYNEKIQILKQKYNSLSEEFKKEENNIKLIFQTTKNLLLCERREAVKKIKFEKNTIIKDWELNTPKDVRTSAVQEACTAFKTGISKLKKGEINHFNLKYRKKLNNNKCVIIPKNLIIIDNEKNNIRIAPDYLDNNCFFQISKKTIKKNKDITINHDCKIVKQKNKYFILIPITIKCKNKNKPINYCGVDPSW
jgi:hypothetical protein